MRCLLVFSLFIRFWLTSADEKTPDYCTLLVTETIFDDNRFSRGLECEIPGDRMLRFDNLPRDLEIRLNDGDINSNEDMFPIEGVDIVNRVIYVPDRVSIDLLQSEDVSTSPDLMQRPFMEFPHMQVDEGEGNDIVDFRPLKPMDGTIENRKVVGNKKVLALWVQAADTETAMPMDDGTSNSLANKIFGVSGDAVNLRSQYSACSAGKLEFEPANGKSTNGPRVSNGVYAITIKSSIKGANRHDIVAEVEEEATALLGNLSSQYDHVMFCLPSGTKTNAGSDDWAAYAYVNHWKSVYNGVACKYMSTTAHEVGHNLNLGHSNLDDGKYLDKSCLMGVSYQIDDGPAICFNGPKSWQLGWYSDRHVTLKSGNYKWSGDLYGVADYAKTDESDKMIVRLAHPDKLKEFYISFNSKTGANSETFLGGDKVLVHRKKGSASSNEYSELIAELSEENPTVTVKINGESIPISVSGIDLQNRKRATVHIGERIEKGSKGWRIFASTSQVENEGGWDVNELEFYENEGCSGSPLDQDLGTPIDSGNIDEYYSSIWNAEGAFGYGSWGGLPDEDDKFWLGKQFDSPVDVKCVKIENMDYEEYGANKVRVQRLDDEEWKTVGMGENLNTDAGATNTISIEEDAEQTVDCSQNGSDKFFYKTKINNKGVEKDVFKSCNWLGKKSESKQGNVCDDTSTDATSVCPKICNPACQN